MIGSLDVVIGPLLKSCHLCDCPFPLLGLALEANAAYTWWVLAAGPLVRVKSSFPRFGREGTVLYTEYYGVHTK